MALLLQKVIAKLEVVLYLMGIVQLFQIPMVCLLPITMIVVGVPTTILIIIAIAQVDICTLIIKVTITTDIFLLLLLLPLFIYSKVRDQAVPERVKVNLKRVQLQEVVLVEVDFILMFLTMKEE